MGVVRRVRRRLREEAAYRRVRARVRRATGRTPVVAVVHVFYGDLWPAVRERLDLLPASVPVLVTVPAGAAVDRATRAEIGRRAVVLDVPNRGRDVLPFLVVAGALRSSGVDAVLKLHTKRSPHAAAGDTWRDSLLADLLPDAGTVADVVAALHDPRAGVVLPAGQVHPLRLRLRANGRHLRSVLSDVVGARRADEVLRDPDGHVYAGGTMLWARLDALAPLLDLPPGTFEREAGQVDGTMAHAVERLLCLLPDLDGRETRVVDAAGLRVLRPDDAHLPAWAGPEDLEEVGDG